jgi:hypothetical protein
MKRFYGALMLFLVLVMLAQLVVIVAHILLGWPM